VEDNGRVLGTVQWFSRVKGYGFIRPDGEEEDVFIHYSLIQGEGYRNLARGQRVEFIMEDTPKGPQAAEVIGLEMESDPDVGADEVELETDLQQDVGADEVELETDLQQDVGADEVELETDLQQDVGASVVEVGTGFQHDEEEAEF